MPKIAYQYEYQTDVKDIEFAPHKRSAVWGETGTKREEAQCGGENNDNK
jgi:hypothetical protein